jgi:hypothetical protein
MTMAIEVAGTVFDLFGMTSVLGGLLVAVEVTDRVRRLAAGTARLVVGSR